MPAETRTQCTILVCELKEALAGNDRAVYELKTRELTDALYPYLVKNAYKFRSIGILLEHMTADRLVFDDEPDLSMRPPPDVCGLINEGWMRIWEKLGAYDPEKKPFENWAMVVARNWWFDLNRRMKRRLAHIDDQTSPETHKVDHFMLELSDFLHDFEIQDRNGELSNRQKRLYKELRELYEDWLSDSEF